MHPQRVWVVCLSSCEHNISRSPQGKFFKFGQNIPSDSKMNWFDFCGRRSKGKCTVGISSNCDQLSLGLKDQTSPELVQWCIKLHMVNQNQAEFELLGSWQDICISDDSEFIYVFFFWYVSCLTPSFNFLLNPHICGIGDFDPPTWEQQIQMQLQSCEAPGCQISFPLFSSAAANHPIYMQD